MSSSVHVDNKEKDILILGEGPTQQLDDTTLTAEAKYPINFTQSGKRFVLSLHYNGSNSFLFVNATKVYQFKAKNSKINIMHCAEVVFQKILRLIIWKKWDWRSCKSFFCWFFNPIDTNDISDIHKYSTKRTWYKIIFGLIRKYLLDY